MGGHPAKTEERGSRLVFQRTWTNSHGRVGLDGEQVMIAPREMGRRHDHQSADVTVGRGIAEARAAARTEKPRGTHLRVTHAERCGRRVGQPLREAHHHQVRAHLGGASATCRSGVLLCGWRRDELEKEVFEVSFVHGDTERAYVEINKWCARPWVGELWRGGVPPVLSHSSRQIFISAARATSEIRIRSLMQDERVSLMFPGSTVVSEPKMIRISREECVGRWLVK